VGECEVDVTESAEDGAVVVRLSGEIDITMAEEIAEVPVEVADGSVIVDLAAVTFLDCQGLGSLIALRERAAAAGNRLLVRSPSRTVTRLLRLLDMRNAFNVVSEPAGETAAFS
jgi:anti-anti-sigma factor